MASREQERRNRRARERGFRNERMCGVHRRHIHVGPRIARPEAALREGDRQPAFRAIVGRENQSRGGGIHQQVLQAPLGVQIQRWRRAPQQAVQGHQIFAATQFAETFTQ